jgi:hypothetical protein
LLERKAFTFFFKFTSYNTGNLLFSIHCSNWDLFPTNSSEKWTRSRNNWTHQLHLTLTQMNRHMTCPKLIGKLSAHIEFLFLSHTRSNSRVSPFIYQKINPNNFFGGVKRK